MYRTSTFFTASLGILTALSGCDSPCSFELIESSRSRGPVEAELFRKNCGATTGFVYELYVGEAGSDRQSKDLALRFDSDHSSDWPEHDEKVLDLSWSGESELEVIVTEPVRVFHEKEASSSGTRVSYQFSPGTKRE